MLKSLCRYVVEEVKPRTYDFFGTDLCLAVTVGCIFGFWGNCILPVNVTKNSEVSTALLTYAALALGFSLAGLTLVLTIPSKALLKAMADDPPPGVKHTAYSDLVFIFSWTALIHWIIVMGSLFLLLLAGTQPLWIHSPSVKFRILAGCISAVSAYGLFQFLIVLLSLYHLAQVNLAFQRKEIRDEITRSKQDEKAKGLQ